MSLNLIENRARRYSPLADTTILQQAFQTQFCWIYASDRQKDLSVLFAMHCIKEEGFWQSPSIDLHLGQYPAW